MRLHGRLLLRFSLEADVNPSTALLHTLDLQATELQALLDRQDNGPPDDADNRKQTRTDYRVPDGIVIEPLGHNAAHDYARVAPRDISPGGLGLLHRGAIPGGTRVAVHLPNRTGQGAHLVTGRVIRCFCLTKDVYDVGVAFDEPLDLKPIVA